MNFEQRKKEIIKEIENILVAYGVEWKTPAVDDMIFSLPEALYHNAFSQSLSDYKKELVEEIESWANKNKYPERNGTSLNMVCYEDLMGLLSLLQKDKENK